MKEPRVNEAVRAREVRLIGADGEQVGIVSSRQALEMAEEAGLDLVEVAPNARPPVCKLLDYGKYKYEQKQKAKEARRNASHIQVKEVKLRPKTDEHDILTKIRHIRRFLEDGDKAKVTIMFRGREITHSDRGRTILERIKEEIGEEANVEMGPRMEGRTMIMIMAPAKSAPTT
ncbi:MAG: translation initiation factor IF-3 [Deltaproteobacteria bacterium]|nr:MAG: translation initiation factor IF-3 [Deltaproteobacteria bacterium]